MQRATDSPSIRLRGHDNELVPLIVAFTPNYLVPVATTLRSVLLSSDVSVRYDVICLVGAEPSEAFKKQLALIDGGEERLSFRYMNLEHKLRGAYVDPRYSSAANYRLVIAEELPEYEYALYTDCDIIMRQDIASLYRHLDMGNCYMAGVVEASTEGQIHFYQPLGCKAGEYINSGFLVLNLTQMRLDGISERFAKFLTEAKHLDFPDQDAINVICQGRIYHLPPVYNGIRTFLLPAYRNLFLDYYSSEQWEQVHKSGNIHYTGQKPWAGYTIYLEVWWSVFWGLPRSIRNELKASKNLVWKARLLSLPLVRRVLNWYQLKTTKQQR